MPNTQAPIERHKGITRELAAYAALAGDNPTERAAALITAATVIIESEVGTAMAPAALLALIEPTIAHWQQSAHGRPE